MDCVQWHSSNVKPPTWWQQPAGAALVAPCRRSTAAASVGHTDWWRQQIHQQTQETICHLWPWVFSLAFCEIPASRSSRSLDALFKNGETESNTTIFFFWKKKKSFLKTSAYFMPTHIPLPSIPDTSSTLPSSAAFLPFTLPPSLPLSLPSFLPPLPLLRLLQCLPELWETYPLGHAWGHTCPIRL